MEYQRKIKLEETDATGAIFFTKLQAIGVEYLEIFLNNQGFSVMEMMKLNYLFPIVHVEANYHSLIQLADLLQVKIYLKNIGTKSVTFFFLFEKEGAICADLKITHVLVSKLNGKSLEIPAFIRDLMSDLPALSAV